MRSFFAFLFFLLVSGATVSDAYAQLECTNRTELPVWIAIAYNYTPPDSDWSDNDWVTEGWLYIKPGDTVTLSKHMGYDKEMGFKNNFFYYAYQPNGREWKGIRKFALDKRPPNAKTPDEFDFKIRRAHKNLTVDKRRNPNYERFLFKGGDLGDKSYAIIELGQNDINDTPDSAGDQIIKAPGK